MFKPKKAIPYLAAGFALSGCEDNQNQDYVDLTDEVRAFCMHLDTCYPGYLEPEQCNSYYTAYIDAIRLVKGDNAGECLAAWETIFNCYADADCEETEECDALFDEDENGDDILDRACFDDGPSEGGSA